MAHEIDTTTNASGSVMLANTPAWHGLGTVVDGAQTSADALRIAGLDWEVGTADLAAVLEDGTTRMVPDRRATYRTDTGAALGAVGRTYRVLQNREAFAWLDDVVGEQLAMWHTCGSLQGGRAVWALAKLPTTLEVSDRDVLEKYVLVTNRHDGLGAVRLFPTSVRVVCANTLRFAGHQQQTAERRGDKLNAGLRLCHVQSQLRDRVEQAREVLGVIDRRHEQLGELARAMAATPVSTETVVGYFEDLVINREESRRYQIVQQMRDLFDRPTNSDGFGANVWTLYNAASEFADHHTRVIGTGEIRAERRFTSRMFGAADQLKQSAWQAACQLVSL
jgi:phage/plasmid-like protein (TIGR03299 family)